MTNSLNYTSIRSAKQNTFNRSSRGNTVAVPESPKQVLDLKPRDHVTLALRELHWLPVEQRIEYLLSLLVRKTLIGHAPDYMSELLTPVADMKTARTDCPSPTALFQWCIMSIKACVVERPFIAPYWL